MGWISKIFKGSSHNESEGQYDWGYGTNLVENYPSTSWDAWSGTEDIDRAIALSLSEEDKKGKIVIDDESQLKEDEQLARALQESLNIESPPPIGNRNGNVSGNVIGNGNGNFYQPIPFPYSTSFRICAGCNVEIGHGRFLSCMGAVWHPECFRCHACNQPISDYEFSMSGSYPYHKSCYKEHYHPKCDVCKHFIPTNAAGLIEYRAHPFWAQKYCPFHEHDGTPRCCSCERMEPRDTKYVALDDGRKLCLECLDSAIMDTDQCQPLYVDIQEFYEGLNMKVEQQVPLLLVERQALNEAMDGEKNGHYHMPETRGLCLSEEQTVSTILRRPKIGAGNQVTDMRTEPYKLTRRCEVTAILILYGLPRLLTGSILAHEMMHAWLRLRGYRTLSQDVEEGICQVLAHMWLESQIISVSGSNVASTSSSAFTPSKNETRSPFEKKLGEFFKHQIESDTSPIYGNGFRAGHQAVLKYGLQRTLDHIRFTGCYEFNCIYFVIILKSLHGQGCKVMGQSPSLIETMDWKTKGSRFYFLQAFYRKVVNFVSQFEFSPDLTLPHSYSVCLLDPVSSSLSLCRASTAKRDLQLKARIQTKLTVRICTLKGITSCQSCHSLLLNMFHELLQ